MREPPSRTLQTLLHELGLCSPADLRRCRRIVRRLAADLPAFDFVWLDALVQLGVLTPFQAARLDSSDPRSVCLEGYLLIDEISAGPRSRTFLARPLDRRSVPQRAAVKVVELDHPGTSAADPGIRPQTWPAGVVGPHRFLRRDPYLIAVSRFVDGPDLSELIVRRGRIPPDVVLEIGRQLAAALAALEAQQTPHGEIRARLVKLTARGEAVLVDAGLAPLLHPAVSAHLPLPPDRCDGIAPERIATGLPATAASDRYGLGCLLWHLLAGRPPFPAGEALARLQAHQTRPLPDVRELVPDVPRELAASIAALTSRRPEQRPSPAECLALWRPSRASTRRKLAAFVSQFRIPARAAARTPASATERWLTAAAVAFAASGLTAGQIDYGARTQLAAWLDRLPGLAAQASEFVQGLTPRPQARPLPAPNAHGLILLTTPGPYAVSELHAVGPLTIRGTAGAHSIILVDGTPLALSADQVRLEHVELRFAAMSDASVPRSNSLVRVRANHFRLADCVVAARPQRARAESAGAAVSALHCRLLDDDPQGASIALENTRVDADGAALAVSGSARRVVLRNVLKTGAGPLIDLVESDSRPAGRAPARRLEVGLERVTCRRSGSIVRWGESFERSGLTVQVRCDSCVLDLEPGRGALVEFSGGAAARALLPRIRFIGGTASVLPEGAVLAALRTARGLEPLPDDGLEIEGLAFDRYEFAGPDPDRPADNAVVRSESPRQGRQLPGIDARSLLAD